MDVVGAGRRFSDHSDALKRALLILGRKTLRRDCYRPNPFLVRVGATDPGECGSLVEERVFWRQDELPGANALGVVCSAGVIRFPFQNLAGVSRASSYARARRCPRSPIPSFWPRIPFVLAAHPLAPSFVPRARRRHEDRTRFYDRLGLLGGKVGAKALLGRPRGGRRRWDGPQKW